MNPYIFDYGSAVEYKRLDLMSKILDPWTHGYLTSLGVAEGWHCLELGGGNGSITEWLAAKVGGSGSVDRDRDQPCAPGTRPDTECDGAADGSANRRAAVAALRPRADPNYWTQCSMMTAVWLRKSLSD